MHNSPHGKRDGAHACVCEREREREMRETRETRETESEKQNTNSCSLQYSITLDSWNAHVL